jgi:hypothetical protein
VSFLVITQLGPIKYATLIIARFIQKKIDQNRAKNQVANDVNSDLALEDAEDQKIRDLEVKVMLDEYKRNVVHIN